MPAVAMVAVAAYSAYSANKNAKDAKAQQQEQMDAAKMDPRLEGILYGDGTDGNTGLLGQYQKLGQAPQSPGLQAFGQGQDSLLGATGQGMFNDMRGAASNLMGSSLKAPQVQAAKMQDFGTGVLWNTGESYKAPDAMRAAQVGTPNQVTGATVNQPKGMQAAMASAAQVNAPSQNNIDLSAAYKDFVSGSRGDNPFLTGAIGKGINQSKNAFDTMQDDATRNLRENVLPSIRSNSVLAGQYGGSRQGIAEGRALGDFGREQQRAISQFGQNNTDAAVAAQAGAYETDSNRALSATQGLGAQQYGVAQQDASMRQQAELQNAQAATGAAQTNYSGLLSGAMANAGYGQQAALANQGANLAASTTNAGLLQDANRTNYAGDLSATAGSAGNRQQANLANQQAGNNATMFNATQQQNASNQNAGYQQQANLQNAGLQQQTNSMNSANQLAGIGASQGLLGGLVGNATNQNNYALNQAAQVNGLLQPYILKNNNVPASQPIYANTGASALGGAMAGLGLYNQFNQAQGGAQTAGSGFNSLYPAGGY